MTGPEILPDGLVPTFAVTVAGHPPDLSKLPLLALARPDGYRQRPDGQVEIDGLPGTVIRCAVGLAVHRPVDDPADFEGLGTPPGLWAIHTDGSPLDLWGFGDGFDGYRWDIPAGLYRYPDDGTPIEFWQGRPTVLTTADRLLVTVLAPRRYRIDPNGVEVQQ